MTDITNIIILTAMDDGAWTNSDHGNVDLLNEYLRKNYQGSTLAKVDEYGGGRLRMSCDVFMGAIDYLNQEAFLEQFHCVEWGRSDSVQLLLKGSKDDFFQVFSPKI